MKSILRLTVLAAVLLLVACGDRTSTASTFQPAESLATDPGRLEQLRAECKADRERLGNAQCNAVSEAIRLRFMRGSTPRVPAEQPSVAKPDTAQP